MAPKRATLLSRPKVHPTKVDSPVRSSLFASTASDSSSVPSTNLKKTRQKKKIRKRKTRKRCKQSNVLDFCVWKNNKACKDCSCKPPATPVEDNNKASNSDHIEFERVREMMRKRRELEEELLREPPFRAICIKAAELEAYNRHPNSDRNDEKVQEDVRRSVEEETRKLNQAECAAMLARNIVRLSSSGGKNTGAKGVLKSWVSRNKPEEAYGVERKWLKLGGRLLDFVKTETKDLPAWRWKKPRTKDVCDPEMRMDKMPVIVKLTGVTIFPKVGKGGDTIAGTLEAHDDKFIYKASTSYFQSQLAVDFENVKEVLIPGKVDENMPSFLHFWLHNPIKVGTEKKDHMQFRLVPTTAVESRPDDDSDKTDQKEKQTMDIGRRKDLKDFVLRVGDKWGGLMPPFSFSHVFKQWEFQGVLASEKVPDVFVLSYGLLLQISKTPFVVVKQTDIEIVHLARLRPKVIDMTVVFKNISCPVLQISSIPLDSLEVIKKALDGWGVKFYDNSMYLEWGSILRNIAENPETFIKEGGWDGYKLEDSATLLYYRHYYLELSQSDLKKKDKIWG